jgi:hypothetical protein
MRIATVPAKFVATPPSRLSDLPYKVPWSPWPWRTPDPADDDAVVARHQRGHARPYQSLNACRPRKRPADELSEGNPSAWRSARDRQVLPATSCRYPSVSYLPRTGPLPDRQPRQCTGWRRAPLAGRCTSRRSSPPHLLAPPAEIEVTELGKLATASFDRTRQYLDDHVRHCMFVPIGDREWLSSPYCAGHCSMW